MIGTFKLVQDLASLSHWLASEVQLEKLGRVVATTLVVRRAKAPKMTLEKRILMILYELGG